MGWQAAQVGRDRCWNVLSLLRDRTWSVSRRGECVLLTNLKGARRCGDMHDWRDDAADGNLRRHSRCTRGSIDALLSVRVELHASHPSPARTTLEDQIRLQPTVASGPPTI